MHNEIQKKYVDFFVDNEYKSIELYSLEQFRIFIRSSSPFFYSVVGVFSSKGGSFYIVFKRLSSYFCVLVRR